MRSALLRGRDHHDLGAIAAIGEGRVAIALSLGGAPKRYRHTEPNEDATIFAVGDGGMLVAVADGHHGCRAAELALEWILRDRAPAWTASDPALSSPEAWEGAAFEAMLEVNRAILAAAGDPGPGPGSTTLSLALVRPGDDLALCLAIGDSHVFRVDSEGAREIGWNSLGRARCYFLGDRAETPETLRDESIVLRERLGGTRALVLATDGLSEHGIGVANPALAVESCMAAASEAPPDRRSYDISKRVLATALDAQRRNRSGDNAAAAVVWLAD
jgi:serine/threonine protein phosphatase PrpC